MNQFVAEICYERMLWNAEHPKINPIEKREYREREAVQNLSKP